MKHARSKEMARGCPEVTLSKDAALEAPLVHLDRGHASNNFAHGSLACARKIRGSSCHEDESSGARCGEKKGLGRSARLPEARHLLSGRRRGKMTHGAESRGDGLDWEGQRVQG
eukprot:653838-Pleurochrysis_carterae.AAC.1